MSLGMSLFSYGTEIHLFNNKYRVFYYTDYDSAETLSHSVKIAFAGSLLASLCWVSVYSLKKTFAYNSSM